MKSDEVIQKAEAEVAKAETAVIRWSKATWAWAKTLPAKFRASSLKTKAIAVVAVIIALMVIFDGVPSQSTVTAMVPDYMTRAQVRQMVSDGDATTLAYARASAPTRSEFNDLQAQVQKLNAQAEAIEAKLSSQITTGSLPKKAPVRRYVRKPASSSWLDLP
jgi:hypothetical protein